MATCNNFNNHAELFLRRMQETFPEEPKIKLYRQKFEMVRTINSRKPVELFMENLKPFGEQILSENEIFFKQDECVGSAENISGKMGLIKYWDSLNDVTKKSIWEFTKGLYVLGMSCLGHSDELQELMSKIKHN
jgi:hypothetical protein